jgi:hypothetical protein
VAKCFAKHGYVQIQRDVAFDRFNRYCRRRQAGGSATAP